MPLRLCKLVTPCLQKYPWFPEYPPYIFFICCKVVFSCINEVSWTIPSLLDFLTSMISLYHSYTSFKYTVCIDSLWFPRSVLVVTHKETSLFISNGYKFVLAMWWALVIVPLSDLCLVMSHVPVCPSHEQTVGENCEGSLCMTASRDIENREELKPCNLSLCSEYPSFAKTGITL